MATSVVGSVTAELLLDTGKFQTAIGEAKELVKGLGGNFANLNTGKATEQIAQLEKQLQVTTEQLTKQQSTIDKQKASMDSLKTELEGLRTAYSSVDKNLVNNAENFKKAQTELESYNSTVKKTASTQKELWSGFSAEALGYDRVNAELKKLSETHKVAETEMQKLRTEFGTVGNGVNSYITAMNRLDSSTIKSAETFALAQKELLSLSKTITKNNISSNIANGMKLLDNQYNRAVKNVKAFKEAQRELLTVANNITQSNITNGIKLLDQKYERATKSVKEFTTAQKELLSVSRTITQQNIANGMNLLNKQYDSYVAKLNQARNISAGGLVNNASGQYARAKMELEQLSTSATKTSANLEKLSVAENQASSSASRLGTSARTANTNLNSMTTATSKLQGAMSSLKMMGTALSSMFIWTFGMSLYEATKQTLQSKNEMESYLNQMGMGSGAINLFNKGLDETADRFKKLNKYMIGETIASIGMEFELNAVQMRKSMEVVAMIQNEYVRAGRKESEASLAVKDILQGEFLRLSRETGVGKQDLIDTGLWQGDLKDVEGLMDALKKVGEDRHWDLFAEKCLSLNDVVNETKNRISEFGASLVDQFSPAIVKGFNMVIGVIDTVTSTWNNFNPMEKLAVGIPAVLAFGTALLMVAGNLTLMDIAQMGYGRSLLATILRLDTATVKEYGLATALSTKISGLEASTVAEIGNRRAIMARLLGLDASIVKEGGLSGAIALSATVKGEDTFATQWNTLVKDENAMATIANATATGDFTAIQELCTAVLGENTTATQINAIMKEFMARQELSTFRSIVVLVTGLKAEEVQAMSTGRAIWALISSHAVLVGIGVGVVLAGIAIALGSLAMEAQRAKEAIDGFNDIVDNGDGYLEEAQQSVEGYTEQINNLTTALAEAEAQGKDTFQITKDLETAKANKQVAERNVKDIQNVNETAKKSAEDFQKQITMINTDFERKNSKIFEKLGYAPEKATELASTYTQQYLDGMEQMRIATEAYAHEIDEGGKHLEENAEALEKQRVSQENLTKYVKDYGEEVLKNAQYQKEWAEGDFWALFKIGLSDIKLAWIDFTTFMSQYDWAKDLLSLVSKIADNLKNIYVDDFKKIGDDVKFLCDTLETLYDWVTGKKGEKTKEYLDKLNSEKPHENPQNYMNEEGEFDIKSYFGDNIRNLPQKISEMVTNVQFQPTSGITGFTFKLLDMLLPQDLASEFQSKLSEILGNALHSFDWIGALFNGGGDGSTGGGTTGVGIQKKIPVAQLLGAFFGDVDFEGMSTWVMDTLINPISENLSLILSDPMAFLSNFGGFGLIGLLNGLFGGEEGSAYTTMYTWVTDNIVTPFSQSIQTGLLSVPIVGDILAFLGLADSPEVTTTADQKGQNVGWSFGSAVENKIRSIPILGDVLSWLGVIDGANPTANQKGHNVGKNVHDGVDSGKTGTADLIRSEMDEVINAVSSKIASAYATAQQIGSSILNGINSILQHHSPGVTALLVADEMMEIVLAMANAKDSVFASAQEIGTAITSGIQPNTDISFDAQAMAEYQANSMMAMGMADETVNTTESAFSELDYSTMTTFGSIGTTIGTTMTNIASTTKMKYTDIANTTKLQLTNMQSQTTKNISAIRTSWTGMQTALINSAEHIRSETGAKIHSLQNNMASFWRKVQNPALLLGAGSPSEDRGRKTRYSSHGSGVRKVLSPKGFAGSPSLSRSNSNPRGARTGTGITDKLPNRTVNGIKIYDILSQYIECLEKGEPCYAGGGWNFNWSKDIKDALMKWHTHFGQIYDPYLYVGKFENDTFPVRGIAPIAKNYIYDAISRTSYEYYMGEKYGSPLATWNAGHFNCYDGALLVMALASAFGFTNSTMVHGSWGGIPHVWARIAGLGDIDATAIQGHYGFTAPSRTGAGGDVKPRFKHNGMSNQSNGNTINGDINITINGADKDSDEIGREVRNSIIDLFSPNPATGQ